MRNFTEHLESLRIQQTKANLIHKPEFYRIQNRPEQKKFEELLSSPGIIVVDYIFDQIKELIKYKTPSKKFKEDELEAEVKKHLGNTPSDEYGVWIYYPWSNRLVHILDEPEFIDIRTSRNQNKITKEERDILAKKKIGVIGLSVGQSVSVTLAMERICGELRLADFDILELTNLNRIRTGIHNLGLPKVYSVAREIAEIDPFLNVICYPKGLSEDNMDDFFTGNGKLDLLVEESDGFDIKILSRYKARELKIPVIMEASDRCMVDVERFDLEPNRSILHGLVEHLDIATLKSLKTNEEKIPYMLDVLGLETASIRLKASMLEIEQTISTWPQLASAVTMGGGITADVSRRILLNYYTGSGRFHIDIEDLIGDKKEEKKEPAELHFPELTKEMMEKMLAGISKKETNGVAIPKELAVKWIKDSIQAPSAGNNQPWKWLIQKDSLYLFHDKNKSVSWTDPFDHLAHLALGACLENLTLSATESGYHATVNYLPVQKDSLLVASVSFSPIKNKNEGKFQKELYGAINIRCTNRKRGNKQPIEKNILEDIGASVGNGFEVLFIEDEKQINELGEIVSMVEKLRFLNPNGHYEFFNKELRWTHEHAQKTRDGIELASLELSHLDQTGLKVASNTEVISNIRKWKGGGGLQKITRDAVKTSSAVGLLKISDKKQINYLASGRNIERVWLMANYHHISFHPISSPLFFFERLGKQNDLPADMQEALKIQEQNFNKIFSSNKDNANVFLFRLSKSDSPSTLSLRRDADDFIVL
jgi:molybdopterin/thiamine biosynthesis adenylyltransferase